MTNKSIQKDTITDSSDVIKVDKDILERIKRLEAKYENMGQDLRSYLDGLLYADYLTYWDYIRLDVLLSLQAPLTPFKDEEIFIMYHQITELHFKLCLHALKQITNSYDPPPVDFFIEQIRRVNSYFKALIGSFEIMIDGMDKEQFLQFRMSLLPASGFQSAQYRMIELYATNIDNLIAPNRRATIANNSNIDIKTKYENLYWKQGATELATGKKTLTLKQFEKKYSDRFLRLIKENTNKNVWVQYQNLPVADRQNKDLVDELRKFDLNANVNWPLMHYKSAVRYLHRDPMDIAATGGSNWQKYLPPKNQKIIFYPELFKSEQIDSWGTQAQKSLFK